MRQSETEKQEAKDRADRIARAELADVKQLMATPAFRRYAKRYLGVCNVFKTTFTGNSETFFKEGQRSIGTTMLGEIMAIVPDQFAQMMAEKMPGDELEPEPDDND